MTMFLNILKKRRSIRQFEARPVEPEKIETLVEAVLRSPSSRSLNPWEFVVVTDPAILAALAACKPHGATFVKNAPLAIVVCADPENAMSGSRIPPSPLSSCIWPPPISGLAVAGCRFACANTTGRGWQRSISPNFWG